MGTPWPIPVGAPTWTYEDKTAIFGGTQLQRRVERDGEGKEGGCVAPSFTLLLSATPISEAGSVGLIILWLWLAVHHSSTLDTVSPCCCSPWTNARGTAHVSSVSFCSLPIDGGLLVACLLVSLSWASSHGCSRLSLWLWTSYSAEYSVSLRYSQDSPKGILWMSYQFQFNIGHPTYRP